MFISFIDPVVERAFMCVCTHTCVCVDCKGEFHGILVLFLSPPCYYCNNLERSQEHFGFHISTIQAHIFFSQCDINTAEGNKTEPYSIHFTELSVRVMSFGKYAYVLI